MNLPVILFYSRSKISAVISLEIKQFLRNITLSDRHWTGTLLLVNCNIFPRRSGALT